MIVLLMSCCQQRWLCKTASARPMQLTLHVLIGALLYVFAKKLFDL